MKKIINGRLYNTNTAKCVGYFSNDLEYNDINAFEEKLYRKKNGEFFLYGWGGANTEFAEKCGTRSWCSGESIRPISINEAKEWAEENLSADKYIDCFGDVDE